MKNMKRSILVLVVWIVAFPLFAAMVPQRSEGGFVATAWADQVGPRGEGTATPGEGAATPNATKADARGEAAATPTEGSDSPSLLERLLAFLRGMVFDQ